VFFDKMLPFSNANAKKQKYIYALLDQSCHNKDFRSPSIKMWKNSSLLRRSKCYK